MCNVEFHYRRPSNFDPDYDPDNFDADDAELFEKEPWRIWDSLVVVLLYPEIPPRITVWSVASSAHYGLGWARAVSQRGAQMEVTAWMESLDFFPAPGRPGRWHPPHPVVLAKEWQTHGGLVRFFEKV